MSVQDLYVQPCICTHVWGGCVFDLCVYLSWENILSLATGCTWGHGAAEASLLLGS